MNYVYYIIMLLLYVESLLYYIDHMAIAGAWFEYIQTYFCDGNFWDIIVQISSWNKFYAYGI